jgi:hypothetical protein
VFDLDWESDDRDQWQPLGGIEHALQTVLDAVQQRALVEQIIAGVRRDSKLGEERHDRPLGDGLLHQVDDLDGIEGRVRDPDAGHTNGDPREVVIVKVEELLACFHYRWILPWASMLHG